MAASGFEKAAAFFHSRVNRDDFSRQQVLKWALGSVCNIFWYFIHEYALFFVCPGLALGW